MERLKKIRSLVIENLTYYDAPINEMKVKMFAKELDDSGLMIEKIANAFRSFRLESGRRLMPMPSDIIAKANPKADHESLALDSAARIIQAVSKYGYPNPEHAKNFIGELGWHAVQRFGGWQYICENLGVKINQQTLFAQARDLLKATIRLDSTSEIEVPVMISTGSNEIEKAQDVVKQIVGKKRGDL